MITERIHKFESGVARQGDVLLRSIDCIPDDAIEEKPTGDVHVIAHSETGHNHVLGKRNVHCFQSPHDPLVGYIDVLAPTNLEHQRDYHTHETIGVGVGKFEIRRQREHSPEGWRRAAD